MSTGPVRSRRDIPGFLLGVAGVACFGALTVLLWTQGGWWWLAAAPTALVVLVFGYGIGVSMRSRPRDEYGVARDPGSGPAD